MPVGWKGRASCLSPSISQDMAIPPKIPIIRLPAVHHDRARLDSVELLPFKRYIYDGYAGVMTGHLYVPALDKARNKPVSMSRAVVTDLLQKSSDSEGCALPTLWR